MDQWLPLAGIIILVLVLWFVWSLTRNRTSLPDRPDPDLIRPGAGRPEPAPAPVASPPESRPAPDENPADAPVREDPVLAADSPPVEPPAASGPPDDLRRLKGLGPKLEALLISLGITRYDQIASWTADDIARIDSQLGTFSGRIERDNWVEQARLLAAGDIAGFEVKFGKLDAPKG
jgi:predicted flap endonuclease-1-like 5' DNA nuclease